THEFGSQYAPRGPLSDQQRSSSVASSRAREATSPLIAILGSSRVSGEVGTRAALPSPESPSLPGVRAISEPGTATPEAGTLRTCPGTRSLPPRGGDAGTTAERRPSG